MSSRKGPGLPTLNDSRAERYRRLTTGKSAIGGIPPRIFLIGLGFLLVSGFLYYRNAVGELEQQRGRLMAKQRAVSKELSPRLLPLRDAIEREMASLATAEAPKNSVRGDVDFEELFGQPGIYLRLRLGEARDLELARKAAQDSLRDGFTSCLIRDTKAVPPYVGEACTLSKDCAPGELCTEFGACQRPSSPFNMRLLYRALGVLSEQWVSEVRDAHNDLALVAYERGLDSVTEIDIPVAIDVYQRAKYAVVVLDEDPAGGLPAPIGEVWDESEMQRIQRSPHFARVGVYSLPEGKQLARVRAEASGQLRDVGGQRGGLSEEASAARARQANSCALALGVKSALLPRNEAPTNEVTGP